MGGVRDVHRRQAWYQLIKDTVCCETKYHKNYLKGSPAGLVQRTMSTSSQTHSIRWLREESAVSTTSASLAASDGALHA